MLVFRRSYKHAYKYILLHRTEKEKYILFSRLSVHFEFAFEVLLTSTGPGIARARAGDAFVEFSFP